MIGMPKLDWRIYPIVAGVLLLAVFIFFLEKIFFFLIIVLATVLVAGILRFLQPVKYLGVELVTLSTMLVGVVYGPLIGGIYAFVILLVHLILGDYYIGTYLMWVAPEYILLGVLSGIFGTAIIGPLGVSFIVGLNLLSLFFTFIGESDRVGKELPYVIGNIAINSVIFIQLFGSIVNFID